MPSALEVREWHTRSVTASDGQKIGKLEDVYVGKETGEPQFLLVESGVLGHTLHLVPSEGATLEGEDVRVAFDKATIDAAPAIPADDDLSPEEERRLFEHYGRAYDPGSVGVLILSRWVLVGRRPTGR
jgi:sporulation protein YlmC with PRC-barrel domain